MGLARGASLPQSYRRQTLEISIVLGLLIPRGGPDVRPSDVPVFILCGGLGTRLREPSGLGGSRPTPRRSRRTFVREYSARQRLRGIHHLFLEPRPARNAVPDGWIVVLRRAPAALSIWAAGAPGQDPDSGSRTGGVPALMQAGEGGFCRSSPAEAHQPPAAPVQGFHRAQQHENGVLLTQCGATEWRWRSKFAV